MEYALFLAILFYLLPWVVAEFRGHPRATRILALNVLTGWTVGGWLAALAWALWMPQPQENAELRPLLRALPGGRSDEDEHASADAHAERSAARGRLVLLDGQEDRRRSSGGPGA